MFKNRSSKSIRTKQRSPLFLYLWGFFKVCLLLALLFIVLVAWTIIGHITKDKSLPMAKPFDAEAEKINVQLYCKDLVRASLKSPKSADFPWETVVTVDEPRRVFTITSYVDAKNSFGAEIRTYYTCSLDYKGGGEGGWEKRELVIFN